MYVAVVISLFLRLRSGLLFFLDCVGLDVGMELLCLF